MPATPKAAAKRKTRKRNSLDESQGVHTLEKPAENMTGNDGRNANGTFAKGNCFGPGNPHARACARMLAIFRNAISDEEMHRLFRKLFEMAETGDMGAAKLILSYKIGKPLPVPNPDSIDRDEWEHFQQDIVDPNAMKLVLGSLPTRVGNDIARISLPTMADAHRQKMAAKLQNGCPAPEPKPAINVAQCAEEAAPCSVNRTQPIPIGEFAGDESDAKTPAPRQLGETKPTRSKPIPNGEKGPRRKKNPERKSAKSLWLQPLARRLKNGAVDGQARAARK
jgi:hypothetical protein